MDIELDGDAKAISVQIARSSEYKAFDMSLLVTACRTEDSVTHGTDSVTFNKYFRNLKLDLHPAVEN